MKLIALYPILFEAHQYKVGDVLPAHNEGMVKAWLEAGTAKWEKDKTQDVPEDEEEKEEQETESCAGATELSEEKKSNEQSENETGEKELIGRSAKNAGRKKEEK